MELVSEHRVRGITEGVYRSVARSFWVSPAIVGRLGEPRTREALLGLGFLLDLSEQLQADLAQLAAGPPTLPSFGIAGDIRLAPEDGAAFVAELQRAFGEVLERYGGGEGHAFRLALACYPEHLSGELLRRDLDVALGHEVLDLGPVDRRRRSSRSETQPREPR